MRKKVCHSFGRVAAWPWRFSTLHGQPSSDLHRFDNWSSYLDNWTLLARCWGIDIEEFGPLLLENEAKERIRSLLNISRRWLVNCTKLVSWVQVQNYRGASGPQKTPLRRKLVKFVILQRKLRIFFKFLTSRLRFFVIQPFQFQFRYGPAWVDFWKMSKSTPSWYSG